MPNEMMDDPEFSNLSFFRAAREEYRLDDPVPGYKEFVATQGEQMANEMNLEQLAEWLAKNPKALKTLLYMVMKSGEAALIDLLTTFVVSMATK